MATNSIGYEPRSCQYSPRDFEGANEWETWKMQLWNTMAQYFYPGLAALEQYMLRSNREKRCVDCGESEPTERTVKSGLVKSIDRYYLCTAWE